MIANEELRINEDIYKRKRSISSQIGNNLNSKNNIQKGIKSRHRKMASSYFLGSYISGDELHKFAQEYKGINNDNKINNIKNKNNDNRIDNNKINIYDKNDINNLRNLLLDNKKDYESNNNNKIEKIIPIANSSFYSYSIEEENDKDKKTNTNKESGSINELKDDNVNESLTNNCETKSNSYINNTKNNPFYELEKNSEKFNKDKSFIPIKNGLKYLKDKDERVTESYLMALNGGEIPTKNGKNQYLPTASIIEEEKSELIESTSKKQSIIKGTKFIKEINFKKKKIENEFNLIKKDNILENSNEDENKENLDINIQNNNNDIYDITTVKKCPKLDFDLNKIKIKNNHKDEKKRKCLRKNKENLLKCFYNLSFNKCIPSSSLINNSSVQSNQKNDCFLNNNNTIICNQILNNKNKIINNNITINKEKKKELIKSNTRTIIRIPPHIIRKKRNFSYSGGYISFLYHQRFNTENNAPKNNEKIKYNCH